MDREVFCYVLELIKGSDLFTLCQEAVPVQLAIAVHRQGNSSSLGQVATKFGTSEGAVENFTTRVVEVLNSINSTWIKWPDANERKQLGSARKYFPKCIGFIDGSDANFYRAPNEDKQSNWSTKKRYCMQFQIVRDPLKNIRSLYTGYPGSVHDAKVYASSPVLTEIPAYFSKDEFIRGDSAYPISATLITPYRRRKGLLSPAQKIFNRQLSNERVAVEHTIGILKGRFQCLQGLRINVEKKDGHENACRRSLACAMLHNILQKSDTWNKNGDDIFEEDESDSEEDDDDPGLRD